MYSSSSNTFAMSSMFFTPSGPSQTSNESKVVGVVMGSIVSVFVLIGIIVLIFGILYCVVKRNRSEEQKSINVRG